MSQTHAEFLTPADVKTIIKAARTAMRLARTRCKKKAAERDLMILLLLECTGGGLEEICRLRVDDIDLVAGVIELKRDSRTRRIPIAKKLLPALSQWMPDSDWLFPNRERHITCRAIELRFVALLKRAGLSGAIRPNSFRRTFAKAVLNAGVNIAEFQELLGIIDDRHAGVAAVAMLGTPEQERMKKALDRI